MVATSGDDDLFEVTRNGMTIRFNEEDVRSMGRDAAGVRGIRLRAGDAVVSLDVAADDTDIVMVTDAGYGKRTKLERFNRQARGGQGVRGIRLTGKRGTVVAAFMVALDEEILLVSSGGVVIRTQAREIASQGRDATGVRVMNLDEGQSVAAVLARERAEDRRLTEPADPRGVVPESRRCAGTRSARRGPRPCRRSATLRLAPSTGCHTSRSGCRP